MKRITFHSRSAGDQSFDNVLSADFSGGNHCRLNLNGADTLTFAGWESVTIEAGPAPPVPPAEPSVSRIVVDCNAAPAPGAE